MDTGSTIVGAILLGMCLAPFVVIRYYNVRKTNKMKQALNRIAKEHSCKIGQHEFCGNIVIGFDENKKFVFFHNHKKEQPISQYVELANIQSCQVVKKTRNANGNKYNVEITERLELFFITANKTKETIKFVVFEEEANNQIVSELLLAEKWAKDINRVC